MLKDKRGVVTLLEGRTHLRVDTVKRRFPRTCTDHLIQTALKDVELNGWTVLEVPLC